MIHAREMLALTALLDAAIVDIKAFSTGLQHYWRSVKTGARFLQANEQAGFGWKSRPWLFGCQ